MNHNLHKNILSTNTLTSPSTQHPQQQQQQQYTIKLHNNNNNKFYFDDEILENLEKKSLKSCLKNDIKLRNNLLIKNSLQTTITTITNGNLLNQEQQQSQKYLKYITLNKQQNELLNPIFKSYLKFKHLANSLEIEKSIVDYDICVKPGDKILEINHIAINEYNIDNLSELINNNPNGIHTLTIETTTENTTTNTTPSALFNNEANGIILNTLEETHNNLTNDIAKGRTRDCCLDQQQQQLYNLEQEKNNVDSVTAKIMKNLKIKIKKLHERSRSLPNTFDIDSLLEYLTIRSTTTKPLIIEKKVEQQHEEKCRHLNTTRIDIRRARSFRDLTTADTLQQQVYRLNDFMFNEKIGEGFFAYVKKITHRHTGQIMVLKELKIDNNQNDNNSNSIDEYTQAYNSFLKEAQILRYLNHPNIIKFFGVLFTKDRQLNLILEYIGGGTLKDIIHNVNFILPWKIRVSYAKDIAYGMEYLHSLNIIHRDLKSDNCLIRENGSVVIADFGLSRVIEDDTLLNLNKDSEPLTTQLQQQLQIKEQQKEQQQQQPQQTQTETGSSLIADAKRKLRRRSARKRRYAVVGNSFSMAPEMLKHQVYDERVDIFSFGILCCEIIGRVQADPDYLPRTSDFGLNVELFRKKYCEADCPKHFIQIAIACCELEPDKRPAFSKTHTWLETILLHLETNNPIPKNLLKNILNSNIPTTTATTTTTTTTNTFSSNAK